MPSKTISKLLLTFLATSLIYNSPVGGNPALAANSLMELFGRKPKPAAVVEQPAVAPIETKERTEPKAKLENIKRVTVSAPKAFDYKPERMVLIDFAAVDSQKTGSTSTNDLNAVPTVFRPYNAILESPVNANAVSNRENSKASFANIDVHAERDVADAVLKYYEKSPHLIWSENGHVGFNALRIREFLANSGDDGLEPKDYYVALPDNELVGEEQDQALTQFDVELSARILRYVIDASQGRLVADRLSPFHDLPRKHVNLEQVMDNLAKSEQPVELMNAYLPQSEYYQALKNALAKLPKSERKSQFTFSRGFVVKPGETNDELPHFIGLMLANAPSSYLHNHREILERYSSETIYNADLVNSVKDYQKLVGKNSDGIIGSATVAALQDSDAGSKRQKIIDSMERLRWLPHNFGDRYVFINQASYRAQYIENNTVKLDMKVVVGNPKNQTYFFYDKIRLVTFNPSWGVPRSIVLNEMLPKIINDQSYLERNNYALYNSSGKQVSASAVNWQQVAAKGHGISIRQKPGKNNALGELKILFPNKHDIYLHDTPNKAAFSRDMRAVSHGCVRLENPREMAAAVLGKSVDQLKPYFGKGERSLTLDEQVPVYLTYFTAWPDLATGRINYYSDVYNRDQLMATASEKTDISRDKKI